MKGTGSIQLQLRKDYSGSNNQLESGSNTDSTQC